MEANEEFIRRLYPAAIKVAQETGMSWELILAQAAHETGWGRKVLSGTNNLYNIKASAGWEGETKIFRVWERDKNGKVYWTNSPFRVYDSFEDSLRDRVRFLRQNPRYAKAGLFDEGTLGDLRREAEALERAGYATDDGYADLLVEVFNGRTMRRLVAAASGAPVIDAANSLNNRVLREGMRGQDVAQLQSDLERLGYTARNGQAIAADGHFGEQTRLALQAYQRDHKLQPDGVAGPLTRAAVADTRAVSNDDPMPVVDRPAPQAPEPTGLHSAPRSARDLDILRIQQQLNALGMRDMSGNRLVEDGMYGNLTQTAVARFQAHQGLPITGEPDDTTRRSIESKAFLTDLQQFQEGRRHWEMPTAPHVANEGPTIQWRDQEGPTIQWRQPAVDPLETDRTPGLERTTSVRRSGDDMPPIPASAPEPKLSPSDPRNPESPNYELYSELGRRVPYASEERLLQFTAACHINRITGDNLSVCHLDEANMRMGFLGKGPLTTPVTVDLSKPPPEPEQAVAQIAQYDQQQALVRSEYLAQQQQQQMSRGGPSL